MTEFQANWLWKQSTSNSSDCGRNTVEWTTLMKSLWQHYHQEVFAFQPFVLKNFCLASFDFGVFWEWKSELLTYLAPPPPRTNPMDVPVSLRARREKSEFLCSSKSQTLVSNYRNTSAYLTRRLFSVFFSIKIVPRIYIMNTSIT